MAMTLECHRCGLTATKHCASKHCTWTICTHCHHISRPDGQGFCDECHATTPIGHTHHYTGCPYA